MPASPIRILWLDDPKARDPALVGGKAAALARLRSRYPVPPGFVVPWTAFGSDGRVPVDPVIDAYRRLHAESVAVRSSAVDEDGREASFAGQHTTVLHVRDAAALVEAVRSCRESGRSEAALAYRRHLGVADEDPARVAVLVQTMVRADAAAIGFSRAPAAFGHDVMLINAGFGLGDSLASGRVTPDVYAVRRQDLGLLRRELADKTLMTVMTQDGVRDVPVPERLRRRPSLDDEQIRELARLMRDLETEWNFPVDVEVAWDGDGLHLLQCRPVTAV